jgi:hypothetical protein
MNWPWKRTRTTPGTEGLDGGELGTFWHPVDPTLSPRVSFETAKTGVHRAITELHRDGAVDAGNGDVLDAWIDRMAPQWHAHLAMESADRDAAAQLAVGEYEAAATHARHSAEATRAEVAETRRLLDIYEQRLLLPNEPGNLGHPERRRRPRPSVDSLEGLTTQPMWSVVSKLLLLLAAAGDLASFYVVVAGMMPSAEGWMIWVLTAAFTAAAVGVMHVIGRTARNLREGQGGIGRVALAVMVLGWVALGTAAFWVRTHVTPVTASATEVFGGGSATTSAAEERFLSALLLAALFVGSGILAYWIGFSDHHPRMHTFRKLRKQLTEQRQALAVAEKAAVEAEQRAVNARAEVVRTKERAAMAQASIEAEVAELKELARIHIAGLIGEPATTNNLVSGRSSGDPLQAVSPAVPSIPPPAAPVDAKGVLDTGRRLPPDALNGHPAPVR